MDLLTACGDDRLFKPWFKDPATWRSWFTFIRALFALPLEGEDLELFTRCTGRAKPPEEQASEGWLVCGRRSGKSFTLALIATYLSTFKDWRPHLSPGERATVMVVATDTRQARVIMRYIQAFLEECALLRPMIEKVTRSHHAWSIDLDNRVTVEVNTASFRAVRGYTIVAALLDELAFWRAEESANPDREVVEAIRPALVTVPGSMLLAASSPYSRRGLLWDVHRRNFAKDGPVLVWQSDTRTMNPTVAQSVVDAALERDASVGASEWLAQFRSDIESFVSREAVEACVEPGMRERPPVKGLRYEAFVDPSGGRSDSMTMSIGHREGDSAIIDCLREVRPPFDPASTVQDFAETIKSYWAFAAKADRYGGEWVTAEFARHGIRCGAADKPKSDLYRELLPMINSRRVELLDHARLIGQICSLERRVGRGGRDAIDHPPGSHDDLANVVAGVAAGLLTRKLLGPGIW